MNYQLWDEVALTHDIPEHSLKTGDLGVVVHVYKPDGLEVEFLLGSGGTRAVLTLRREDVRLPGSKDVFAVRPLEDPAPR